MDVPEAVLYEIDVWGESLGVGASDSHYCTMGGVAKIDTANVAFAVANEFICARLGLLIGLPMPPGVVATTDDGRLAYVSLRFGPRGERPPPVNAQQFVEDNPATAAGVVAFDCWVANTDRNNTNLAYVRGSVPLVLFDHGHALLGTTRAGAVDRLNTQVAAPVVGGCVAPELTEAGHFQVWDERIRAVHDDVIRDVCRQMIRTGGLTPDEGYATELFLLARKTRVLEMLDQARAAMPKVVQWPLV